MPDLDTLVEQHRKLQYASSVHMVAQQNKNPLDAAVTKVPASGEAPSVADLIGAVEYQRGQHHSPANPEEARHDRDWPSGTVDRALALRPFGARTARMKPQRTPIPRSTLSLVPSWCPSQIPA